MSSIKGPRIAWATAIGPVPYTELPAALSKMSQMHARRALALIGAADAMDLIDQAFSVGAALELLLKAALAEVDVHLIRKSSSNHIAGVALSGLHRKPTHPPLPDIRTVGSEDALKMLTVLTEPNDFPASTLGVITAVRDSAVHMGFVDATTNEKAVSHLVKAIDWVLKTQRGLDQSASWEDFWGTDSDRATEVLDARNDELFTEYTRKISVAKATFARLISTESGRDAVAYLEEGESPLAIHEISRDTPCPACGCRGRTLYELACVIPTGGDPTGEDGVALIGRPRQFQCGVCKLALLGDELERAGLGGEEQPLQSEISRQGFADWFLMADTEVL